VQTPCARSGLKREPAEGLLWLAKVAEMAAGCCFDETQRRSCRTSCTGAMHATDVRMVKVTLAEQLDAAYPSSCSTPPEGSASEQSAYSRTLRK
jgi:hypothetical protein